MRIRQRSRQWITYTAVAVVFLVSASACGVPATPQVLPATATIPTRVPTEVPAGDDAQPVASQPTAVAAVPTATIVAAAPTLPPTSEPTATRRTFSTATPNVTAVPGDPAVGEALFLNGITGNAAPACSTCHNIVDDGTVKAGPLMGGVATHGAMHAGTQDIYTYLHTSIVNPNAYLVPNEPNKIFALPDGTSLMYQNYAQDYTETQIRDLVAYLMTLR